MRRWAVLFLLITAPASAEPARLALVIGSSAYAALPPIPACDASAGVVSAALRRAGFVITDLRNPSNGQMGAAIGTFADALAQAPDASAVIYSCGYAVGFEDRAFLLPTSARLDRETDVLTQGLVVRVLTGAVGNAGIRAGLVLLDTVTRTGAKPAEASSLGFSAPRDNKGLLDANSLAVPPDGPTALAGAIGPALAGSNAELGEVLTNLRSALQGAPRLEVTVQMPQREAWLIGGPASVVAAPPPSANPPIVPTTAPVPTPLPEPAPAASGPAPALNEADRREVQLSLQRLGYYAGRVDGAFGPESLAAIRRFQHEIGADVTGRLTTDQAARLLAVK